MSSIINQVQRVLTMNTVPLMKDTYRVANGIPKKRHEAKELGVDQRYIYSFGTLESVLARSARMANWVRDRYEILDIRNITLEMTQEYLENYPSKKKNTIMAEKNAIMKLEQSMIMAGYKSKHDPSILPEINIQNLEEGEPYGYYTQRECETIITDIEERSPISASVVEFQAYIGARVSEAIGIMAGDIDIENRKIRLHRETKGGKIRNVSIPQEYFHKLQALLEGKKPTDHIFSISQRNVQDMVEQSCQRNSIEARGTHGFRGYAAFRKMKSLGYDDDHIFRLITVHGNALTQKERNDLKKISQFLGHERISVVRSHYLTR